jgi:preprotein translocase subunit SecG
METILIVVHLMIVLALVGVVLLQRSEGGGLDIGGGSGFMTARGAANALTRATAILAAAFFATSLGLSILARYGDKPIDILDRAPATQQNGTGGKGILDQLPGSTTPAQPAGNAASKPQTPPTGEGAAKPAPATQPATPAQAAPEAAKPAANGAAQPAEPQVPNN